MELMIPLGTALVLGLTHSLEADHVAAVGSFVVRRPRPLEAAAFGARWAAGHGAAILIAGTALAIFGARLADTTGASLETLVGVSLIALGMWNLAGVPRLHVHACEGAEPLSRNQAINLHSHRYHPGHSHRHAITAIGALHGLAGTAPAIALIPLTATSALGTASWILAFALGTAGAMAVLAMTMGFIVERLGARSTLIARSLIATTALATIGIGLLWL